MNVITWNEYWTLLEAGASGGEMPDVFWMHINEAQQYMEANMLLIIKQFIERTPHRDDLPRTYQN